MRVGITSRPGRLARSGGAAALLALALIASLGLPAAHAQDGTGTSAVPQGLTSSDAAASRMDALIERLGAERIDALFLEDCGEYSTSFGLTDQGRPYTSIDAEEGAIDLERHAVRCLPVAMTHLAGGGETGGKVEDLSEVEGFWVSSYSVPGAVLGTAQFMQALEIERADDGFVARQFVLRPTPPTYFPEARPLMRVSEARIGLIEPGVAEGYVTERDFVRIAPYLPGADVVLLATFIEFDGTATLRREGDLLIVSDELRPALGGEPIERTRTYRRASRDDIAFLSAIGTGPGAAYCMFEYLDGPDNALDSALGEAGLERSDVVELAERFRKLERENRLLRNRILRAEAEERPALVEAMSASLAEGTELEKGDIVRVLTPFMEDHTLIERCSVADALLEEIERRVLAMEPAAEGADLTEADKGEAHAGSEGD